MASDRLASILISDTTLRDGEQMAGATLTVEKKVRLAQALAAAGVNSIEAGFPACSPAEIEAVCAIAEAVRGPMVLALCRALRTDIDAAQAALHGSNPFRCAVNVFLATSPLHREAKFGKTKEQILAMVADSVAYARQAFRFVCFSPEDASRTEPDFLCEVYRVAIAAGATTVSYPDTVGILTPEKTRAAIRHLFENLPELQRVPLAAHFHDDLGLAVANTLAAIDAGVRIAQCTVNGIGERAGNASLEEVVLALSLHPDQYRVRHSVKLDQLLTLSRLVSAATGIPVSPNKAVSGSNIFTTEAGIHQDGLLKNPMTYLPYPPELVGADGFHLTIGKHSGRAAVRARLYELGYSPSDEAIAQIAAEIAANSTWNVGEDAHWLRTALARVEANADATEGEGA